MEVVDIWCVICQSQICFNFDSVLLWNWICNISIWYRILRSKSNFRGISCPRDAAPHRQRFIFSHPQTLFSILRQNSLNSISYVETVWLNSQNTEFHKNLNMIFLRISPPSIYLLICDLKSPRISWFEGHLYRRKTFTLCHYWSASFHEIV